MSFPRFSFREVYRFHGKKIISDPGQFSRHPGDAGEPSE